MLSVLREERVGFQDNVVKTVQVLSSRRMDDYESLEANVEERDTDELAKFRSRWKQELGLGSATSESETPLNKLQVSPLEQPILSTGEEPEDEAAKLYWMGVAAEQNGDMDAAVMYYRQAVQLDPDVEFRASQHPAPCSRESDGRMVKDESCDSVDLAVKLTEDIQCSSLNVLCSPHKSVQGTHVSDLPVDVLRYILRWLVSSQLDFRALEQLSMVCRGFYLLAREPQLWKTACRRLWAEESCKPASYSSWREMFILRPHLHFNGMYISKTSYTRTGEHSLDGFYKPYHTVTYYRYLRFFSDGAVMYKTSPEEPSQVVSKFSHKQSSEAILLGNYSINDRTVSIELLSEHYQGHHRHHHNRGRGRGRQRQPQPTQELRFHMELLLSQRKSKQLTWIKHYCSKTHIASGLEQVTEFSINHMYMPFYFSRVRSFALSSVGILK